MGCKNSTEKTPDNSKPPSGKTSRQPSTLTVPCPYCEKQFSKKDLSQHTMKCDEREVSCWNNWCRTIVKQKDLEEHMKDCEKNRMLRCGKCGQQVKALEMNSHYSQCNLQTCPDCGEACIPRLLKFCPHAVLGKKHRAGPFAKEHLKNKFLRSESASPPGTPPPGPTSPAAPSDTGSMDSIATQEPPKDSRLAKLSEMDKRQINLNVARIQHMWRWAKARAVYEDLIFRLIYKELDSKKETFSIFKATNRILGEDEDKRREKQKSKTAQPQNLIPTHDHYFPVNPDDPIKLDHVQKLIGDFSHNIPLPYHAANRILTDARRHLGTLPNINRLAPPLGARNVNGRWNHGGMTIVVGDLHGQLPDLLHILAENGLPSERTYYVFNGDFVDRGPRGTEVFLLLCSLMLCFPQYVALNRGNHECDYMNEEYGFDIEVESKYDRAIFKLVQHCFNSLPLATMLGQKIFIVHGGLPRRKGATLDDINRIHRNRPVPMPHHRQSEENEMFQDLVWSDPIDRRGWVDSDRGVGVQFGPDMTRAFLELNQIEKVIRSHEEFEKGYQKHHQGLLYTVFSASNYDGPDSNYGSFAQLVGESTEIAFVSYRVTEDEYIHEEDDPNAPVPGTPATDVGMKQFHSLSYSHKATGGTSFAGQNLSFEQFGAALLGNTNHVAMSAPNGAHLLMPTNRHRQTRDDVLRSIREQIYDRRHRLLAYFTKIDRTHKGSVWKSEFCETMRNVLNLDLPWAYLRPFITESDPVTQRIHYIRFLQRFKNGLSDLWLPSWEEATQLMLYDELYSAGPRRAHLNARGKAIEKRAVINYNEFCNILRDIDSQLTDSAIFQLFCAMQTEFTGYIEGKAILEKITAVADGVEGASQASTNSSITWSLDAMEHLQRLVISGRAQLSTVFKVQAAGRGYEVHKTERLTYERFKQGMDVLCRSMKKHHALTDEHIAALFEYIVGLVQPTPPSLPSAGMPPTFAQSQEESGVNQPPSITINDLYMACMVRDRVLLQQQRQMFHRVHHDPMRRSTSFVGSSFAFQQGLPPGASPVYSYPPGTTPIFGSPSAGVLPAPAGQSNTTTFDDNEEDITPSEVPISVISAA